MSTNSGHSKPVFDRQGHRGCRGLMPENTVTAMIHAIELGVTTLEMDVVFTSDRVAVLSHEPFFNHLITTTAIGDSITKAAEKKLNIFRMSFAETQQFDVGLKPHPLFPDQKKVAATKPSLADVIDSAEHYTSLHQLPPINYNIETKTNKSTDGLYHPPPEEFITILMKLLRDKKIMDRVIVQSFDDRTLQLLHSMYPKQQTALLIEGDDKRTINEQLAALGFIPTIYSPAFSLVTPKLVTICHEKGIRVIPWTVNDLVTMRTLVGLGVDGIISDYPNLFNQL